ILLTQEGRQDRAHRTARPVDESSRGAGATLGRKTCLTSKGKSRRGGGRCWLAASKLPGRWMNWKVICVKTSSIKWSRDLAYCKLLKLPSSKSVRPVRSRWSSKK